MPDVSVPDAAQAPTTPGYLVGCHGCGGMFMLDQPAKRTAPKDWIGPPDLTNEPFYCARCAASRPTPERCDCGCTLRPGICSCEVFDA